MKKEHDSIDSIDLYNSNYFLKQVDGFTDFYRFDGTFDTLFERYQSNIKLLELSPRDTYLEFGCGRGELCIYHAKQGGNSTGVDYSEDAINLAKEKAKSLNATVDFQKCSFSEFRPNQAGYTRILASEFIEHISSAEGALFIKLSYAALRPGGKILIFTYPNTLQRKFGYPLMQMAGYFFGLTLPRQQADTLSEHYKKYHLNEQNYITLCNLARLTGSKKWRVGYDQPLIKKKNEGLKNIIKNLLYKTPLLKHLFLNNLYLIIEK